MLNPLDLSGRSVLVTGASSGIGRETACLVAQLGGRVIATGRSEDRLRGTLGALAGEGHAAEPFDLGDAAGIPIWIKRLRAEYGPLHGLVHCAGVHALRPLRILDAGTCDEMMHINVTSAMALARGFTQRGVAGPGSSIVLLSSVAGFVGQAGVAAYAASKGAIAAMSRSLAVELAAAGIRVNCVAPGMVRGEMTSALLNQLNGEQTEALESRHLLGFGCPRDVAHAIIFLLAETARWITGTTLVVDGGYSAH